MTWFESIGTTGLEALVFPWPWVIRFPACLFSENLSRGQDPFSSLLLFCRQLYARAQPWSSWRAKAPFGVACASRGCCREVFDRETAAALKQNQGKSTACGHISLKQGDMVEASMPGACSHFWTCRSSIRSDTLIVGGLRFEHLQTTKPSYQTLNPQPPPHFGGRFLLDVCSASSHRRSIDVTIFGSLS